MNEGSEQYNLTVPMMKRGRRRRLALNLPVMPESEYQAAIAQFIKTRGVTRCPTACVIRTQGMPEQADREALSRRAQLIDSSRHEKRASRSA